MLHAAAGQRCWECQWLQPSHLSSMQPWLPELTWRLCCSVRASPAGPVEPDHPLRCVSSVHACHRAVLEHHAHAQGRTTLTRCTMWWTTSRASSSGGVSRRTQRRRRPSWQRLSSTGTPIRPTTVPGRAHCAGHVHCAHTQALTSQPVSQAPGMQQAARSLLACSPAHARCPATLPTDQHHSTLPDQLCAVQCWLPPTSARPTMWP